tara:strand:+ start:1363 stop:1602 length:240 start_codon:yes stop_codon:yes gene_type:complete
MSKSGPRHASKNAPTPADDAPNPMATRGNQQQAEESMAVADAPTDTSKLECVTESFFVEEKASDVFSFNAPHNSVSLST